MRGVHSAVDEIRRNVFTEVARLAYEGGDLKRVDMIPYTIVPGEVARHRHDVFLERAIVQERVRLALGMSLQPAGEQTPVSAGIQEAAAADDKYFEEPLVYRAKNCGVFEKESIFARRDLRRNPDR